MGISRSTLLRDFIGLHSIGRCSKKKTKRKRYNSRCFHSYSRTFLDRRNVGRRRRVVIYPLFPCSTWKSWLTFKNIIKTTTKNKLHYFRNTIEWPVYRANEPLRRSLRHFLYWSKNVLESGCYLIENCIFNVCRTIDIVLFVVCCSFAITESAYGIALNAYSTFIEYINIKCVFTSY